MWLGKSDVLSDRIAEAADGSMDDRGPAHPSRMQWRAARLAGDGDGIRLTRKWVRLEPLLQRVGEASCPDEGQLVVVASAPGPLSLFVDRPVELGMRFRIWLSEGRSVEALVRDCRRTGATVFSSRSMPYRLLLELCAAR